MFGHIFPVLCTFRNVPWEGLLFTCIAHRPNNAAVMSHVTINQFPLGGLMGCLGDKLFS